LIQILIEEAKRNIFQRDVNTRHKIIEDRISRPEFHNEINAFPGEISAIRLATKARLALGKFKEDYINFGFFNLIEWRVKKMDIDRREQLPPQACQYRTLITRENAFTPLISCTMQENSEKMAQHMLQLVQLNNDQQGDASQVEIDDTYLMDQEIIQYATRQDLPMFLRTVLQQQPLVLLSRI
jgi:hypothetical protein